MDEKLRRIIGQSTFKAVRGKYIYAKVRRSPLGGVHFMITKDKEETTVVTEKKNLKYLALRGRNKEIYRLISLNVSVPFYSVGFLAAVTGAIAKEEINVLVISTYSKDYLLVKASCLKRAVVALKMLGLNPRK